MQVMLTATSEGIGAGLLFGRRAARDNSGREANASTPQPGRGARVIDVTAERPSAEGSGHRAAALAAGEDAARPLVYTRSRRAGQAPSLRLVSPGLGSRVDLYA